MSGWENDRLIESDPQARLIWNTQCALGGKYVTADHEGKKEIKKFREEMEGWLQRLDASPLRVRLHLGFGWFTDREWQQTPEKCFAEVEMHDLVIALGEVGTIYTSRSGMKELHLKEGMEEGTIGWKQTTPYCRMQQCYQTCKLNTGKYVTDWNSIHHFFGDEQQ